jgi:hypothetical protein
MTATRAIFEVSADARTLAHVLSTAPVGSVIEYSALNRAISRDVQGDARSALESARKIVLTEHSIVFDAVRGVGLKRLSDAEIIDLPAKARAHIRRTARKTVKALVCVEYGGLSRENQVRHNTAISMMGVISEVAAEKSAKRLAGVVESAGTQLPAAKAAIAALGFVAN